MNLGTMLTSIARRKPAAEAVVCAGRRLTFGELERRAGRIAGALIARGQKPGARVALFMANCMELVEAMPALAKSGGVMVPVSPRLAPQEIRCIFDDCDPFAILYAPEYREAAREAAAGLKGAHRIVAGPPGAGETAFEELAADGTRAPRRRADGVNSIATGRADLRIYAGYRWSKP